MKTKTNEPKQDLLDDVEKDFDENAGHLFTQKTKWIAAGIFSGAVALAHENLSNLQDIGQHARALAAGTEMFGLLVGGYCVTNVVVNVISKKLTGKPAADYFLPRMAGMMIGMTAFLGNTVPPVFDVTSRIFDGIESEDSSGYREEPQQRAPVARWNADLVLRP